MRIEKDLELPVPVPVPVPCYAMSKTIWDGDAHLRMMLCGQFADTFPDSRRLEYR